MTQWRLPIWYLSPLPFLNSACTSESSWFTYYWSLAWRILSITLLACEMSTTVWQFQQFHNCVVVSLALPFFRIERENLFQSCGYWWVFQICWHECRTLIASLFRIWNSSAEIPSPPLALFVVMLPKANLSWHYRMSGVRGSDHTIVITWVIKIFFV